MTLDRETRKEIERFVREKPRTIQEIAELVGRSWRTADRYTEQMEQEEGLIRRRTFREGTRGALKIAYWNEVETFNASKIQEQLLKKIETGRGKDDFSPFDIYQCAGKQQRNAFAEEQREENVEPKHNLFDRLREAQDSVMFFSGNLSWANVTQDGERALDVFRELAEDGVDIKFLGRVDVGSLTNTEALLDVNGSLSRDRIHVRHSEQPLRAFVVDDKLAQFKELRRPGAEEDISQRTYLFYEVTDQEWVEWVQQVFWKLYRGGIPAERRLEDLRTIQNVQDV